MNIFKKNPIRVLGMMIAMAALSAQVSIAEEAPLVDLSLGIAYAEDFNSDNGAWTASAPVIPSVVSSWARGVPTSGPGIAFSGANVWATNLAGNYLLSECSALLSPPINLTGATSAAASFMQWRHMESATTTAFDGGLLFVTSNAGQSFSLVTPAGGYTSAALGTTARACLQSQPTGAKGLSGPVGTTPPAAVYTPVTTDLSALAGSTVQFAIAFASDSSITRAGWYIDDFAVTVDGVTTTETFESGNGGFSVVHIKNNLPKSWSHGTPTTGPAAPTGMWATNLNGNYGQGECATLESAPFEVSTLPIPEESIPFVRATVTWNQFFRTPSTTSGGVVQVGDGGTYKNIKPTTGYSSNPTSTLDACLQDDTQASGGFTGLLNAAGDPMTEFQADLTPYLGKTITLRYVFASTATATTDLGWYVDDVNVELHLTVFPPEAPASPDGSNAPAWTSGGTNTSWAYGAATAGPTGATAYGTNLAGHYNAGECGFIESPEIPGAVVDAAPTLTFSHWYEIESLTSTLTWDGGFILASTDAGATWKELTPNGGYPKPVTVTGAVDDCKATYGLPLGGTYSGNKQTFGAASVSLAGLAGAQTVRLRFVFASDATIQYDGWFIKDIAVGGVPLLPPAPPSV